MYVLITRESSRYLTFIARGIYVSLRKRVGVASRDIRGEPLTHYQKRATMLPHAGSHGSSSSPSNTCETGTSVGAEYPTREKTRNIPGSVLSRGDTCRP